jgi:hypothetical protein
MFRGAPGAVSTKGILHLERVVFALTLLRSIHLDFLGRSPFAVKTPVRTCWISLDFLGFSRTNLDFSMGYADENRKNILSLLAASKRSGAGTLQWRHADGQDLTWGELSLDSDYQQHIVRDLCRM